ncbi:MAG: hypothetical protein ABI627_08195 [Polyangiaceae bacterium]
MLQDKAPAGAHNAFCGNASLRWDAQCGGLNPTMSRLRWVVIQQRMTCT